MDRTRWPVARHVGHRIHEGARAAAIHVCVARGFEQRPEVERFRGVAVVVVQLHVAGEWRPGQFVQERGAGRVAGAIDQLELVAPLGRKVAQHRHDRGDADAARNEQEAGRARVQFEIVARRADRQQVALAHLVGHGDRSAATMRVAFDGDLVDSVVGRVAAQRVVAPCSTRNLHRQM